MDGQLDFGGELREQRRSDRSGGAEMVLVAAEVAELLRVTTAWVYAETRANRLPHVRLGRYVRYRESAILQWLAEEEQRIARERRG
jgi:excisionase family DNA binding protein